MKWYVASDHAGFGLKDALVRLMRELGDEVTDFGAANAEESVDYPGYAAQMGEAVAVGRRLGAGSGAAAGRITWLTTCHRVAPRE